MINKLHAGKTNKQLKMFICTKVKQQTLSEGHVSVLKIY